MPSIFVNDGGFFFRVAVISRKAISSTSFSLNILTIFIGSPRYLGFLNF
jgi:hypothetical protein